MNRRTKLLCTGLAFALAAAGCATPDEPPSPSPAAERPEPATRADSIAMRAYEASGGPEAWASAPYLRFDFATGDTASRQVRARHLWDRRTGAYRLEMPAGGDTTYVVLFDVDTQEGTAYLDGQPVDTTRRSELLQRAYRRFINDTYWLLVPLKLFDPGVNRAYVPDSSTAETDVVALTFGDVGLTPGDRYWLYVDRESGRLVRWAYRLQSFRPDQPATAYDWVDYETFSVPEGSVSLASRKVNAGRVIYTDNIALPADVEPEAFTDPNPRLQ